LANHRQEHEEALMSIVGGLDMHRKQITFDYLDTMTGELRHGKITPADRPTLREWLGRFGDYPGSVRLVVEGCTGWRYVVEECRRAGIDIHLAEPADTASARGPKRHAKTDKLDAKHLRELLVQGRIPESWIPPEQVLEVRAKVRLYKDLRDERSDWIQRIRATLYHQGGPALPGGVLAAGNRAALEAGAGLSPAGAQAVAVALRQIDRLDAEIDALLAEIRWFAAVQPGCKALQRQDGIGKLTAVIIWPSLATPAGSPPPATPSGTPAWISRCMPPTANAPAATSPARARRCCAGRCLRPPSRQPSAPPPIMPTTARWPSVPAPTAPRCRWPASWPGAGTTPCASSATRRLSRCESWTSRVCLPADQQWWRRGWLLRVTAARPAWTARTE
jgi:hypothetical protein